jgi:hypothetical protein
VDVPGRGGISISRSSDDIVTMSNDSIAASSSTFKQRGVSRSKRQLSGRGLRGGTMPLEPRAATAEGGWGEAAARVMMCAVTRGACEANSKTKPTAVQFSKSKGGSLVCGWLSNPGGHLGVNSFLNEVESGFMSDSEMAQTKGATGGYDSPCNTSPSSSDRARQRRAVYRHSFLARSLSVSQLCIVGALWI